VYLQDYVAAENLTVQIEQTCQTLLSDFQYVSFHSSPSNESSNHRKENVN